MFFRPIFASNQNGSRVANDLPYYPGRDTNTSLPLTNAHRAFCCSSRRGCRQPGIQISRHRARERAMFSNARCLVGHHTNDVTSHIKIANWIWLDATRSCRRTIRCTRVHQIPFSLGLGVWLARLHVQSLVPCARADESSIELWTYAIMVHQALSEARGEVCSLSKSGGRFDVRAERKRRH